MSTPRITTWSSERPSRPWRALTPTSIKPLDAQSIIRVAEKTGNIVTVEDHSVNGGLGGAVAEVLCEAGYKGSFKRVGMPDEFAVLGSVDAIYHYYGMDRDGIVKVLENMLRLGK